MKKLFPKFIIISILSTLIITFFKFSKIIIKLIFSTFIFLISFIFLKGKLPFSKRGKDEKVYINYDDIEDMEDTLFEDTVHKQDSEIQHEEKHKKSKRVIHRKYEDYNTFNKDTMNFDNKTKVYKQDSKDTNTGNKYIDELNLICENLHGDMKEKTLEIINISSRIFKYSENIDSDKEFKELLIYTIKMLNEYLDLSVLTFRTDNAIKTMENIENSMNTIIISYYKLLNNQYEKIIR